MKIKSTATLIVKWQILVFLFLFFTTKSLSQIFVSPTGSDTNPGTIDLPLKTIPAAVTKAIAGDTIYVRGGVYVITSTITIAASKSGTASKGYYLFGYKEERPLLDCSTQASGTRGMSLRASYWHIKGFDIKNAGDNGMEINGGTNNIVEFCAFWENNDSGLQLSSGAANNRIINCDSYYNADLPDYGDADGFAPKLTVGTGNYFYGCRAWGNCDDGWDGYMRGGNDVTTTLENCWAFRNGYLKNGTDPGAQANGNGFKMGGSDDKTLMHNFILKNCLSFDNKVRGFDQNSNKGSMTLYNCTSYRNGTNYSITTTLNSGKTATIVNSAVLGSVGSLGSFVVQTTNSWLPSFTVTNDDFVSIDTTGVRGPRKADGSLPDLNFMHLVSGSDLVNSGTDVGLPYKGSAPDLGAYEYDPLLPVELISFIASVEKNSVMLKWVTATESNNLGFEIEKASALNNKQAGEFYTIGFVRGSGTSSEKNEYTFADKNISLPGVYYRLKQVDYNGTYSYSQKILINNSVPVEFNLSQNYPNPFNPLTSMQYAIGSKQFVTFKVYDVLGNEVIALVNEEKEAGTYKVEFDASNLSSGIYFYELTAGSFKQSKKMILLK